MLTDFRVSNANVDFLIDTGSSISLIPEKLRKTLQCNLMPTTVSLKAADSRAISVSGQCSVRLFNSALRRS